MVRLQTLGSFCRRLAAGERGQEFGHLLAADHAVAVRAPAVRRSATAAAAFDPHHVVEIQPDADQTVQPRPVEGGYDDRQRRDQVRRQRDHQLALEQRFADQAEVEVLQVAQAAVNQLAGAARGPGGVVGAFEQRDAVAAACGIERDPGTGDAAADNYDIEVLAR